MNIFRIVFLNLPGRLNDNRPVRIEGAPDSMTRFRAARTKRRNRTVTTLLKCPPDSACSTRPTARRGFDKYADPLRSIPLMIPGINFKRRIPVTVRHDLLKIDRQERGY